MSGSTRTAAIRLSTEDLDAARSKFEALGSLGDQILDRITQAGQRATAAVSGIAGPDDAYARRAADVAAYGLELDRLRARFDPLFAASKRYEATLDEIAFAERVGAINATIAARAREATTRAFADAVTPTTTVVAATTNLAARTGEAAQQHVALGASAGQTSFALRQLGVQTVQAVSSIASGMPVMTTMIQQGHQIVDVALATGTGFGVLAQGARIVAAALLSPIGVTVALGAAFAAAVAHAAALEGETRQLSVTLRAVGRDGELATEQLEAYVRTLRAAGVARADAVGIVQHLARSPALDTAGIRQVAGLTADTAAALGTGDQAAVAKRLGEIASGSYAALKALDDELNILTADQRAAIRVMLEHGERTEAVAKAMDALRARVHGLDQEALSPAARAVRALGNEWSDLMDRIANSAPIQAAVVGLTGIAAAANKLLQSEPVATGLERRIAQIDAKLGELDSYGQPVVGGDAAAILRAERANLLAQRMMAGGPITGGAANAPATLSSAATGSGTAELERQRKALEDQNKALADQQRILSASVADRVRIKAEIEAESYIREHSLTGLAAEQYKRNAIALALAQEADARAHELAAIEREAAGRLRLVAAADRGRAALLQAQAAAQAYAMAADKAEASEEALARAILERNAADAAAKGAETIVRLNEQADATRAIIAAERQGDRAAYYAAIDEKVRAATAELQAHRDAVEDPGVAAALDDEIEHIGTLTREQERLNAVLATERDLREGRDRLEDIRTEIGLVGMAADQRERELAALRAMRTLASRGADPNNLTDEQRAFVEQARTLADANSELTKQRNLYADLGNAATQAFDRVGSAIVDAFVGGEKAAVNWGNVARSVAASVAQEVLKLAVINPLLNAALGGNRSSLSLGALGGTGALGGLFGSGEKIGDVSANGWVTTQVGSGGGIADMLGIGNLLGNGTGFLGLESGLTGGQILGGLAMGVGLGSLANGLARGNTMGGLIGSALGTIALGPLGGLAGGLIGGLFGPGKAHHGWNVTLGASGGQLAVIGSGADKFDNSQTEQQIAQQVAAVNAALAQRNLSVSLAAGLGSMVLGGRNAVAQPGSLADADAFGALRFTAANDNRLSGILAGRSFGSLDQLTTLSDFVTGTFAALEKAPLGDYAASLKALNDQYDAAIVKAKEYAIAEGDLSTERDRRIADLTSRRDTAAASLTAGLQSRLLRAQGNIQGADLVAFDAAAAQQRIDLADRLLALGLSNTAFAADRMVDIEKTLAAERLAIQQKYAEDSRRTAQSLLSNLTIGSLSALAPEQRYFAGLSMLNAARQSLNAGGALSEFTAVAQQVLPVARDFLGTSELYASLVADIASAVAGRGGDPANLGSLLQAQVDGNDALRDTFAAYGDQQVAIASATLTELRRLAATLEALFARRLAA